MSIFRRYHTRYEYEYDHEEELEIQQSNFYNCKRRSSIETKLRKKKRTSSCHLSQPWNELHSSQQALCDSFEKMENAMQTLAKMMDNVSAICDNYYGKTSTPSPLNSFELEVAKEEVIEEKGVEIKSAIEIEASYIKDLSLIIENVNGNQSPVELGGSNSELVELCIDNSNPIVHEEKYALGDSCSITQVLHVPNVSHIELEPCTTNIEFIVADHIVFLDTFIHGIDSRTNLLEEGEDDMNQPSTKFISINLVSIHGSSRPHSQVKRMIKLSYGLIDAYWAYRSMPRGLEDFSFLIRCSQEKINVL